MVFSLRILFHSFAESTSLLLLCAPFLVKALKPLQLLFLEMMFNIFSTSCSNKPKEYNPEQEVFVTRILAVTETRLTMITVATKIGQPSSPTPQFKGGAGIKREFQRQRLL